MGGLVTLALAAGGPWLAQAWAQAEKLPKAEEILDKSVEALGGKAALEKLHTRVSKGVIEVAAQGFKGPVTTYEAAPNKNYTVVEFERIGKIESGTDGVVQWEITPMSGARTLDGAEKALNERMNTFNAPLYWRKLYKTAVCTGVEEVDGRPCYKVVLTPELGSPETSYYDQKTYLLTKVSLVLKGQMGETPLEIVPTDYRKVDGVLLPHKTTQKIIDIEQVLTLSSIEHNVDIPADRFALPEAVKALVNKAGAASQPTSAKAGPAEKPSNEPRPKERKQD
jgi:hypothetical protein